MYRLYFKFRPQTRYLITGKFLILKLCYHISSGNANILLLVMTISNLAFEMMAPADMYNHDYYWALRQETAPGVTTSLHRLQITKEKSWARQWV